jgi:hypothetical protein
MDWRPKAYVVPNYASRSEAISSFRNISFYDGEVFGHTPILHSGSPPLIGHPLLLTQYIHSYTAHLEAIPFIRNIRTRHAVVKGTHLP